MTPSSGRRASSSRVRSIPLPSGSWMSTIAISGVACSTRSRPAATLPAAPRISMPWPASSVASPSRMASWSSTMTSFVMRETISLRRITAKSESSLCRRNSGGAMPLGPFYRANHMAKDTEKLIRQLSLISYLMAERRPVTALEIRRDVEGYSGMNEDAFARRFYADRAELDSLGIQLTVDKPLDGVAEQENYSLRPENFHLPPIAFTDSELASLQFALTKLDGEFAYAEPLRLALQQISWGRPSPLHAPDQGTFGLGITGSAGGHELSQRLAKVETAIFRNKTITFDYFTMERGDVGPRKVDPYHLLFQGGQFYLLGYSHERKALRVFRLSRIRGKVAYATKAEHDFKQPVDFDPRAYANRAEWQFGDDLGTAEVQVSKRIGWQVERHYGRFGEVAPAKGGGILFTTHYASIRQLASWVLSLGEHAKVISPPELADAVAGRVALVAERHTKELALAKPKPARRGAAANGNGNGAGENGARRETAIRPER